MLYALWIFPYLFTFTKNLQYHCININTNILLNDLQILELNMQFNALTLQHFELFYNLTLNIKRIMIIFLLEF